MTWHDFLMIETSRNKHRVMTWLKYITIHLRINIGLQYIINMDEYILKLQIHQHSLLTRKVFSRNNLSELVFLFVSTGSSSISHHIHFQVIFIFKLSSPSSHLHHWIWIITQSGSSLEHHHSIWIITTGSSSLDHHHGCYLLILLVTGSSIEPALFHAGCRPSSM